MTSLWQLDVIWGLVIGTATGAISIPLTAIVATRWFDARRGLVTGLLTASFATGNLIFLPLLAWITDTHGWAAGVAAIAAAAIIPIVLTFINGVATVPPTIALTHEAFGRERATVLFGWVFCAHMPGGADGRLAGRRVSGGVRRLPHRVSGCGRARPRRGIRGARDRPRPEAELRLTAPTARQDSRSRTRSLGRPMMARSPRTTTGRCISILCLAMMSTTASGVR